MDLDGEHGQAFSSILRRCNIEMVGVQYHSNDQFSIICRTTEDAIEIKTTSSFNIFITSNNATFIRSYKVIPQNTWDYTKSTPIPLRNDALMIDNWNALHNTRKNINFIFEIFKRNGNIYEIKKSHLFKNNYIINYNSEYELFKNISDAKQHKTVNIYKCYETLAIAIRFKNNKIFDSNNLSYIPFSQ